jgi:hypothetical protein
MEMPITVDGKKFWLIKHKYMLPGPVVAYGMRYGFVDAPNYADSGSDLFTHGSWRNVPNDAAAALFTSKRAALKWVRQFIEKPVSARKRRAILIAAGWDV